MTPASPIDHSRRRHPSTTSSHEANFAHPSERVFADLLSVYGRSWHYEPVEFPLAWNSEGSPVQGFRPDFYLPEQNLFVELTVLAQKLVTKKNRKVRLFRALYPEVTLIVVYQRDFEQLLARHHLAGLSSLAA